MHNLASSVLPLQFVLKLKNSSEGRNFGIVHGEHVFAMLLSTFAMLLLVMKTLKDETVHCHKDT